MFGVAGSLRVRGKEEWNESQEQKRPHKAVFIMSFFSLQLTAYSLQLTAYSLQLTTYGLLRIDS